MAARYWRRCAFLGWGALWLVPWVLSDVCHGATLLACHAADDENSYLSALQKPDQTERYAHKQWHSGRGGH
ncbi:hypothetical protein BDV19DRAFT_368525 [Aspergillus venezuelensis]